jgi:hypothetical protein
MTVLAKDRTDQLLARRTKLLPKDSISAKSIDAM